MGKIEELLVNKGLYDSVDITVEDLTEMEDYLSKRGFAGNTIDCYCVHCGTKRVFDYKDCEIHSETGYTPIYFGVGEHTKKPKIEEIFQSYLNKRYVLTYYCARDRKHSIVFDLITTDDKIMKIGQYPTVADLAIPEISKYKSILGEQFGEFSKSIGLFAHGIGIGSFVYLRRIIEKLVFDKYNEVAEKIDISARDFEQLKFDLKIEVLKEYLPVVLVSNKNVYGIVSKGIHELSEDECKKMFPYIRAGIELILDDLLAEKERKEKEKVFEKFVSQKTGELRK